MKIRLVSFIKNKISDHKVKLIVAFAIIYFVWGSSYMAIRLAIETIPPFLMAGTRFIIAGLFLFIWCYHKYKIKPTIKDWVKAAIPGILMFVGGNGSVTWSEQFIPSGLASLVVATVPVWLVILDWIFAGKKLPDKFTISGVIVGLIGVAFLFGLDETVLISDRGSSVITGILILTFAAISWAAGSLYVRSVKTSVSSQFLISMQILAGGFVLAIIGSLNGEWAQLSIPNISFLSILSIGYLIVFATLIAYSAYFWLLRETTPAKVGTYAFFNPLVAVFMGWFLLNEPLTTETIVGASFILFSILLVNRPQFNKREIKFIGDKQKKLKEVA